MVECLHRAGAEGGTSTQNAVLVIVTGAFPRGEKMLCVKDGVVIVHPTRLLDLARVMRRMVKEVHRAALTSDGQDAKGAELCAYLSSVEFRQAFDALAESSDKLAGLLSKERASHERDWAKRQAIIEDLGEKDHRGRHSHSNHHREVRPSLTTQRR